MTKKPIFSRKTKFRPKKRISEKISYICTVRATEANDQPCNIRLSAPRRTPRNDDDVHVHVQPFSPGVAPSCTENDTIRLRRGRIFLSDFLTTEINSIPWIQKSTVSKPSRFMRACNPTNPPAPGAWRSIPRRPIGSKTATTPQGSSS